MADLGVNVGAVGDDVRHQRRGGMNRAERRRHLRSRDLRVGGHDGRLREDRHRQLGRRSRQDDADATRLGRVDGVTLGRGERERRAERLQRDRPVAGIRRVVDGEGASRLHDGERPDRRRRRAREHRDAR